MGRILTITALAAGVLAALAAPARATTTPPPTDAVQVMVLGTWHFADPGLDLNNMKSDDVLKPARQAELDAVADAIATFRPTKVMIERVALDSSLADPVYASFGPAMLAKSRDERVQLGYRIARRMELDRVYAIDEQPGENGPDYFPFGKVSAFAKANGVDGKLAAMVAAPAEELRRFESLQATNTMGRLLALANQPQGFNGSIGGYYGLLAIGDGAEQPGAELNAMWYMRNAKIFAKLMSASAPGDRVLVVYGAGHNYWLRHFATETPGFANVDPSPYLAAIQPGR